MLYLDSALLDATEWLCRRFQVLTGRTNTWLAFQLTTLSVVVYFVWMGVYFLRSQETWLRVVLALLAGIVLYGLAQTTFQTPVEADEMNAFRRAAKGLRNPRRLRDAPLRIPFLTLSLLSPMLVISFKRALASTTGVELRAPIGVLTYSLIVLTTIVLYLLACDPLPPCTGKLREWLRGLIPSRPVSETLGE